MNNDPVVYGKDETLPAPADPAAVARKLRAAYGTPLLCWQGDFYEHAESHWARLETGRIRTFIRLATELASYVTNNAKGEPELKKWNPNSRKVSEVVDALGEAVVPYYGLPDECMALENCVLDVATRTEKEHHPSRFNLHALPFRYQPEATCPQWLEFLAGTLPGDPQAIALLQQWFGYVLSGRKDLHKILAMVGPRRSGKGTIASVLEAMVGADGCASPILAQLGRPFGTQGLIGKRLAVMGDVRWSTKETQAAVPVLLALGAEDSMSIPRKNREDWYGRLGVRVTMMSNDLPSFRDVSGALAGRLLLVEFRENFYGREDLTLIGRLLTELPGILNWALDGLDALNLAGSFDEPASALDAREEIERDSSPVAAWVDDWCELAPGHEWTIDSAFDDYRTWCIGQNMAHEGNLSRFSREVRSAFGDRGVTTGRKQEGGRKTRYIYGLRRVAGASMHTDPADL